MRAVLQRVKEASVEVDGRVVAAIGPGLLILLGVGQEDTLAQAQSLAKKVSKLRIFEDEKGHFSQDIHEAGGKALVVSQFTLLADTRKGRRPSFSQAAPPEKAEPLYEEFMTALRAEGLEVCSGLFGAMMAVHLINDGPVTIIMNID